MSATATATLHPDEKYKAGKAGQTLFRLGLVGFIVFIAASLIFSSSAASHYDKTGDAVDQLRPAAVRKAVSDAHGEMTDEQYKKYVEEHHDELTKIDTQVTKQLTEDVQKAHPELSPSPGLGRFFSAYLAGWSWILSIALGAMLFVLIHHAVKAKWSVTTRRLAEILASTMTWIFLAGLVFVIPVLAGNKSMYYWTHPDAHFPGTPGKSMWLSPAFWAARYVVYFAIWIGITRWYEAKSRKMDEIGDVAEEGHTKTLSARMRWLSYPMIIVFALTVCYSGFDILMSTAPKWFSTIYSVNFFGGCMMAGYASISLFAFMLQRSGRLTRSVNAEHYQDLGKMLFAFTFFWTYTAFSQFMLIWYANVPEETIFYNYRMFSQWESWSWVLLFCQFAIPFTFLLSRWTKRILPVFVAFCIWQMVFHWLDLYWNVMPHYHWGAEVHASSAQAIAMNVTGPLSGPVEENLVHFNPVDITAWLAMLFLFVAAVGRGMRGNLIPVKDPNLGASLAHENY